MAGKTTTLVEDGVAIIEVHDQGDVGDVARSLLAVAGNPALVNTTTVSAGVGFRVPEDVAKKAKFVQPAAKVAAKKATGDDKPPA